MKILCPPSRCDSDIQDYRRIISDYYDALRSPIEEVLFDCGSLRFIRPLGVNLLALMIQGLLKQGFTQIYFTDPLSIDCQKYLHDQGFYQEFQIENNIVRPSPRSTSVGLRRMEQFDGFYFDQISRWLNKNSLLPDQAIDDIVKVTLSEIINNVIDHSDSSIGCYVSAQAYPRENRLLFSVVDLGVGFLKTLSDSPKYRNLPSNEQAIALAVKPGVSCKSRGGNIGAGLDILSGFLQYYSGELEIVSMDGRWNQASNGSCSSMTMGFSFPGTCINLGFNNNNILNRFRESASYG